MIYRPKHKNYVTVISGILGRKHWERRSLVIFWGQSWP